jgi:putative ABC transport system ATP-binding protein
VGNRVDLDDVCKQYRVGEVEVDALVGVDLHVDEASFLVILGPSGSGKTTLLNMIGLLDTPSGGRVRLAGQDVAGASRRERTVPLEQFCLPNPDTIAAAARQLVGR